MRKRVLPLILSLLLLAGCTPVAVNPIQTPPPTLSAPVQPTVSPPPEIDFVEFLSRANEERRKIIEENPPIDLSAWAGDFSEELDMLTDEEMDALTTHPTSWPETVSREELLADLDTCFRLLKTTYGAYGYFGGDGVFLPLRDAVRAELEELEAPTVRDLVGLLYRSLSPILVDGHFELAGNAMREEHIKYLYYVPGVYLDDLTGLDMAYVKPTVNLEGAITYGFFAMSHDGNDLPATVGEYKLRWQRAGNFKKTSDTIFEETEREGVPVLVSRSMIARNPALEPQLERFATCGSEYTGKTFLFDLRGNSGGSDSWVGGWFEGWAGHFAQPRQAFVHKYSQLACRLLPGYYPAEKMGTCGTYVSDGVWTPNSGLVFALTDKGVASSGETAVCFLRSADNVLFVGGPTAGCALVPNNLAFYLPNSKVGLYFGTGLSFAETAENRDGVGYFPDLWVNPADAQDAVLRLIDYYGLREKET